MERCLSLRPPRPHAIALPWEGGRREAAGWGEGLSSRTVLKLRPSPHPVSYFRCAQYEPTLSLQGRVKIGAVADCLSPVCTAAPYRWRTPPIMPTLAGRGCVVRQEP